MYNFPDGPGARVAPAVVVRQYVRGHIQKQIQEFDGYEEFDVQRILPQPRSFRAQV